MEETRDRLIAVWRRTISLSWPVGIEQTFATLMRTTDVIITATFSPAAVAAVGLADLYGQISLRLGSGLGGGAIALSSQETGRGAESTRGEAVTQGLLIGALVSIPIILFGVFLSDWAIAIIGADSETVALGGVYLTIILLSSPMRITGIIGARSLQGTGDTVTPMLINICSYLINIVTSISLGFGIFAPRLGIVGVGIGTAIGNTVTGIGILLAIASPRYTSSFVFPRNPIITKQLLLVSTPRIAEGLVTTLAYFPFNAITLMFGTSVNAGYHIGRRLYHQLAGPLYRSLNITASIIVGQSIGSGDEREARFDGIAHAVFSSIVLSVVSVFLFLGSAPIIGIITNDPETVRFAVGYARTFAISMLFIALFFSFSGALLGAGETRVPFIARITGLFAFMLGFSYVVGIIFEFGVIGTYGGIVLMYGWWAFLVTGSFLRGNWQDRAARMIAARDPQP